ncbi:cDENN domain-containing protein [Entamoeba marina]
MKTGSVQFPKRPSRCQFSFQIFSANLFRVSEPVYAKCQINRYTIKTSIPMKSLPFNATLHTVQCYDPPKKMSVAFYTYSGVCVGSTNISIELKPQYTNTYPITSPDVIGELQLCTSILQTTSLITSISCYENKKLVWQNGVAVQKPVIPHIPDSITPIFDSYYYHTIMQCKETTIQIATTQPHFYLTYYILYNRRLPNTTTTHNPSRMVEMLGFSQTILIFFALLQNKNMIMFSKNITTLLFSIIQLLEFIHPFKYSGDIKIPIDFDHITTKHSNTYLYGVISSVPLLKRGVVMVDLDRGTVTGPHITTPPSITCQLYDNLNTLRMRNDNRYHLAFRSVLATLLKDIDCHLKYTWVCDTPRAFFDIDEWVLYLPADCYEFAQQLAQTPMLCSFLHRLDKSLFGEWMRLICYNTFEEIYEMLGTPTKQLSVNSKCMNHTDMLTLVQFLKTLQLDKFTTEPKPSRPLSLSFTLSHPNANTNVNSFKSLSQPKTNKINVLSQPKTSHLSSKSMVLNGISHNPYSRSSKSQSITPLNRPRGQVLDNIQWLRNGLCPESALDGISHSLQTRRSRFCVCNSLKTIIREPKQRITPQQHKVLGKLLFMMAEVSCSQDDYGCLSYIFHLAILACPDSKSLFEYFKPLNLPFELWDCLFQRLLIESKNIIFDDPQSAVEKWSVGNIEKQSSWRLKEISAATNVLNDVVDIMELYSKSSEFVGDFVSNATQMIPDERLFVNKSLW